MEAAANVRAAASTAVILRNLCNMTRLPRLFIWVKPRTWIGRRKQGASWESGGSRHMRRRYILQYGEPGGALEGTVGSHASVATMDSPGHVSGSTDGDRAHC